ncbi:MAG: glycosyltransferase [Bacteroidota bacterium]
MNKITICIATYKRPSMLEKLIISILNCNIDKSLIGDISIIVVDNDTEKTAEGVINVLMERIKGIYKLIYSSYPYKGIVNVRNECLKKALSLEPDYIVFVDDDEYVTPDWLNELVKTIINNNADIVRGPVFSEPEIKVSDSISYWFTIRATYSDNSQIYRIATGNLIMNRLSFQKFDVWFDPRFNITGSSDYFFGVQLLKKGARFYWAANAIAYETIPESRANLKWLIKRFYRGASTFTWVLKLEKKYVSLIKKVMASFIYILMGICALVILPFPIKKRYWGILKLSEGIGGITGLFNFLYLEYK